MTMKNSLEDVFEKEAQNDKDIEELWHKYKATKGNLAKEYYPWVQSKLPYYTDHGERHISSIIRIANELLRPILRGRLRNNFTGVDIFLLLSSIIWHDVGMVDKRSGHAEIIQGIGKHIQRTGFPQPILNRNCIRNSKST